MNGIMKQNRENIHIKHFMIDEALLISERKN